MLSETGLRLFETHMEVTEAENLHRTALWALKLQFICIPKFLCGLFTQQLHIWSLVMSRTVAYLVRVFPSSL